LFSDESRFGNRTQIGYGWFKKNERTTVKVDIGYLAFYIYAAISAITGKQFSAKLLDVDTECMNTFLEDFSKHYEGKKIALIIGEAGWYKSKRLKVHKNINPVRN